MLKINPHVMNDGKITSISIINENLKEVVEISPIPFDIFASEDVKKVISLYYLKKKTCENLIQQLEMAQSEFEKAKAEFESLTHTEVLKPEPVYIKPKPFIPKEPECKILPSEVRTEPEPEQFPQVEKEIQVDTPEPKESKKIKISPHEAIPESTAPTIDEPKPGEFKSEPVTISEPIESAPAPAPFSLEEITTKIIESDELKTLVANNQLSDATIRAVIVKIAPMEWEETVHGMVIAQLKEKGIIEPSFLEKAVKKIRGRPKK